MADTSISQPIIRGIQSVGAVSVKYRYNGNSYKMTIPTDLINISSSVDAANAVIDTSGGIEIAGFRLDAEFLRANPQIASSFVIPILGGGGVALTNNNRTGTLSLPCSKISTPADSTNSQALGSIYSPDSGGIGVLGGGTYYDLVFIAQVQQAQKGGDSAGANIAFSFNMCDCTTTVQFDGCTVASVEPLVLAGNDAPNYNVVFNYLNWRVAYNQSSGGLLSN